MRNKSRHTKKGKLHFFVLVMRIAALLGCLTLISAYMLSGAYSKFYSVESVSDHARVSHFSPSLVSLKFDISNAKPGDTAEIAFDVRNFSDEQLPEVAMKYKIILKTTGNIPLKFALCKSDGSPLKDFTCDGISGEQEYEYVDMSLAFSVGTKETQTYKLKAEWPNDKKAAQFSGMTDAVYLEVEFEQID